MFFKQNTYCEVRGHARTVRNSSFSGGEAKTRCDEKRIWRSCMNSFDSFLFQERKEGESNFYKKALYILLALSLSRCAQITPLTGGKKDTTPPKMLSALPANASLNFNSKQIFIQFDEYIQLRDITNQFIITPQTKELPDIEAQGKTLKINFTESLLPNTTYKLAFGNAIVDLHEGNALPNFEYVFSTGNKIDSLKLIGQLINAINKKVAPNLLVGLYSNLANDSIVYKEKPLYITRTNANGNYEFNYLPTNSFKCTMAPTNKLLF